MTTDYKLRDAYLHFLAGRESDGLGDVDLSEYLAILEQLAIEELTRIARASSD